MGNQRKESGAWGGTAKSDRSIQESKERVEKQTNRGSSKFENKSNVHTDRQKPQAGKQKN